MPNRQAVYMHDTPSKQTFAADYRFLSHGCVRVDGIYDLATWLLNANSNDHWDRDAIVDAVRESGQKRIDLARAVPVAWICLDAWASAMARFIIGRMFTAWTAQGTGIKRGGRRDVSRLPTEIATALINTASDACLALLVHLAPIIWQLR